jgi:16S rRNA (uracil1498-N3)-methyltransferase
MRRFYSPKETLYARNFTLDENETRHLRDVLRLRRGDEARVFDGEGNEYLCVVMEVAKHSSVLKIVREVAPASPESPLDLTLAPALLKGEKFEFVIQKAVELGVKTLIPLQTKRCDVKIKDAEKKLERWRKIAIEAAKQSGRTRFMEIPVISDLESCLDNAGESGLFFSERGGEGFTSIKEGKKITALVGPEGGWDDSELDGARERGIPIVTLGGRILRAETATVSIAAILQHRFGDLT